MRAGQAAAASWPPLTRLRCFLTMFISPIGAPDGEERVVDGLLLGQRDGAGRLDQERRATAGDQREHEVVRAEAFEQVEHPRGRLQPRASGTGCAASTISMPCVGRP